MTNREKFKETFGFKPKKDMPCPMSSKVCELYNRDCQNCPIDGWWDKEYKPCFAISEEFEDEGD